MAETYTYTPVIRLPKSKGSSSSHSSQRQEVLQIRKCEPQECIVSDTLYFSGLNVSANEIRTLLHRYQPVKVSIQDQGRGYLQFGDAKLADRVYALYNGFTFPDNSSLQFRISEDGMYEPEASPNYLQVKNLPHFIDSDALYNLVRPFGPLSLCKPIVEGSAFCGTAVIQYFDQNDSDEAQRHLHGKLLGGQTLHVSSVMLSRTQSESFHDSTNKMTPSSTGAPDKSESGYVDYLNLYIKNLDASVDNEALHNMFAKFGKIVSARVMSNPNTGQSKGYGFVSYEKPEEAAAALQEMRGKVVANKTLIVAYHEPKKPRQEKQTSLGTSPGNSVASSFPTPMPFVGAVGTPVRPITDFVLSAPASSNPNNSSAVPFLPPVGRHPYDMSNSQVPMQMPMPSPTPVNGLGIDNVDQLALSMKSVGQKRPPPSQPIHRKFSGTESNFGNPPRRLSPPFASQPVTAGTNNNGPILPLLASGTNIQSRSGPSHRPMLPQHTSMDIKASNDRPSLPRRGSQESLNSIMTESTANHQRQRLTEAVMKCGDYGKRVNDIVYLLSTLKRKERALCLFNQNFLRERIQAAVETLDICDDGSDDEDNEESEQKVPPHHAQRVPPTIHPFPIGSTPFSPANIPTTAATRMTPFPTTGFGRMPPLQRVSKAIPIVPPPEISQPAANSPRSPAPETRYSDKSTTQAKINEVEAVLASLEGKPAHEKKQQLGDRLFPLVKATGTKQAPKVTIRLLDTIDLNELARLMFDPIKLKEQVDIAFAALK